MLSFIRRTQPTNSKHNRLREKLTLNQFFDEHYVINAAWPQADEAMLVETTLTLPIQINGKRRAEITVAKDLAKDKIEALALAEEAVQRALNGAAPKKIIVVPGRIVNVVV